MGCSSAPPAEPPLKLTIDAPAIVQPARPAPIVLARLHWLACDDKACVTISDAKLDLQNRAKIGRWMTKMKAIVSYYEHVTAPTPVVSDPAASASSSPK